MASGVIKKDSAVIEFSGSDFSLPSTQIAGGGYYEFSGNNAIDVHKNGYKAVGLLRVYTNRSNAVISGFNLSMSSEIVTLLIKNVSQNAVVMDSGGLTVLYIKT